MKLRTRLKGDNSVRQYVRKDQLLPFINLNDVNLQFNVLQKFVPNT